MTNLQDLKINDGVSFDGEFTVQWGKHEFTFPQNMTIDFKKYFDAQARKALDAGKPYTYPKFIPAEIVLDLELLHPLALLSNFTSQATPVLKRFFNIFTNNFASQDAADLAVKKVCDALKDGSCHARIAQGTKAKYFKPRAETFAEYVIIEAVYLPKFGKAEFDAGLEAWQKIAPNCEALVAKIDTAVVDRFRAAWDAQQNKIDLDVASLLDGIL